MSAFVVAQARIVETTVDGFAARQLVSPGGTLDVTVVVGAGMVCSSLRHEGAELVDPRGGVARYAAQGATMGLPLLHGKAAGTVDSTIDSKSSSKGDGAVTRSESIELLVAAVVTDVMPNGNLIISGTQEVRVNFEMRVLTVQGIVRPRDISTENMVSYEKIAEARISYGGKGRLTDIQQPAWGQQLLDMITPF